MRINTKANHRAWEAIIYCLRNNLEHSTKYKLYRHIRENLFHREVPLRQEIVSTLK